MTITDNGKDMETLALQGQQAPNGGIAEAVRQVCAQERSIRNLAQKGSVNADCEIRHVMLHLVNANKL